MASSTPSQNIDHPKGFLFAGMAYGIWGCLPLFFRETAHLPTLEVLAHRVIWSVPIALLVLMWMGRTEDLRRALGDPRTLALGALTAGLVSINWGTYVYAIQTGQALDAALGYYVNPLFSVFLGRVLLGERLAPLQWAAIALAAAAVALLTYETGRLPLIALALTFSWGFYAYFKRSLPIGPNQGFALEVIVLLPVALGCVGYLALTGQSSFLSGPIGDTTLLVVSGAVTAIPLMIYANGAKLLRLTTIGMMQYISPTMIFLIAVFVMGDKFDGVRAITFPMIWGALVLYSIEMLRAAKRKA